MRNTILVLASVFTAACAARPVAPTTPMTYTCDDEVAALSHESTHAGMSLKEVVPTDAQLAFHDKDGDHYVAWPLAATDKSGLEYVVSADPYVDLEVKQYDARGGTQRSDWKLVHRASCKAKGGYSEVLEKFAGGASIDDLVAEFQLGSREQARTLVHDAMIKVQRRYFGDR